MAHDSVRSVDGRLKAAFAAVAFLATGSALNSYFVSERNAAQFPDTYGVERAQVRFSPLIERVPPNAVLAYITDVDPAQPTFAASFLAAQYALAPRLVLGPTSSQKPEWAVGNFSAQVDYSAAGRARGYDLVSDFGSGVVLFRRSGNR